MRVLFNVTTIYWGVQNLIIWKISSSWAIHSKQATSRMLSCSGNSFLDLFFLSVLSLSNSTLICRTEISVCYVPILLPGVLMLSVPAAEFLDPLICILKWKTERQYTKFCTSLWLFKLGRTHIFLRSILKELQKDKCIFLIIFWSPFSSLSLEKKSLFLSILKRKLKSRNN